jgi:hypothetical protein
MSTATSVLLLSRDGQKTIAQSLLAGFINS